MSCGPAFFGWLRVALSLSKNSEFGILKARKQLILLDAKELNYLLLGFFDRHVMHEATKRGEGLRMNNDKLRSVAKAIVAKQKGVLAADESNPTIKKRFDSIKVESTEENRRRYREILFTTEGIERYIGGVILFDETLRQGTRDGTPFAELLSRRGIVRGSRWTKALKRWHCTLATKSPRGLTACASGSSNTNRWGLSSLSGGRLLRSTSAMFLRRSVFVRMPTY